MMSGYVLEQIAGEAIILGTTLESWNSDVDIPLWSDELSALLDTCEEPIFYIGNLLAGKPWTFDQAVKTASAVTRGSKPIFHHPKLKEALIVSSQPLLQFAAKGLNAEVFGNARVKVFLTVEEAFGYARAHQAAKGVQQKPSSA